MEDVPEGPESPQPRARPRLLRPRRVLGVRGAADRAVAPPPADAAPQQRDDVQLPRGVAGLLGLAQQPHRVLALPQRRAALTSRAAAWDMGQLVVSKILIR